MCCVVGDLATRFGGISDELRRAKITVPLKAEFVPKIKCFWSAASTRISAPKVSYLPLTWQQCFWARGLPRLAIPITSGYPLIRKFHSAIPSRPSRNWCPDDDVPCLTGRGRPTRLSSPTCLRAFGLCVSIGYLRPKTRDAPKLAVHKKEWSPDSKGQDTFEGYRRREGPGLRGRY